MAYFSGIMTCLDQLLGTAISLKSRRVAFVGQSGRLGQPLRRRLTQSGAMVMLPADAQVSASFEETDLLILSVLVPQQNLYSLIGELEYFVSTVRTNRDIALKEVWVLLPSSELAPAAGSAAEQKLQTLSHLVSLARLNAKCIVRKVVVDHDLLTSERVAEEMARSVVRSVQSDIRNIVPGKPAAVGMLYGLKEAVVAAYFRYRNQLPPAALDMPSLKETLS